MKTLSAEPFLLLLTIYLHKWLNVIAKERGREKNRREKILKQRLFTNCIVWRKDCSLALLLVIRFGDCTQPLFCRQSKITVLLALCKYTDLVSSVTAGYLAKVNNLD